MNLTTDHRSAAIPETALDDPYCLDSGLQELINTVPTVVWRAQPDGSVEFLNQQFYAFTGLSPKEARGQGWQVIIHPEDLPHAIKHGREVLASGQPGVLEVRMRRSDGEFCWFIVRAVPKRNQQGNIVYWYGNNNEVQDRKQAQQDLRQGEA